MSIGRTLCGCVCCAILLLPGCTSRDVDLRDRILASNASKDCGARIDCIGPSILAVEDGFWLTTMTGGRPHPVKVDATHLKKALMDLPLSVWVRGPEIVIAPTDDVTDGRAVIRNVEEAERVCRALGLDVQRRLGG